MNNCKVPAELAKSKKYPEDYMKHYCYGLVMSKSFPKNSPAQPRKTLIELCVRALVGAHRDVIINQHNLDTLLTCT